MHINIQNKIAGTFVANIASNAHLGHTITCKNIPYVSNVIFRDNGLHINTGGYRYPISHAISIIIYELSNASQIYFFEILCLRNRG